jgi:hypothetical protein
MVQFQAETHNFRNLKSSRKPKESQIGCVAGLQPPETLCHKQPKFRRTAVVQCGQNRLRLTWKMKNWGERPAGGIFCRIACWRRLCELSAAPQTLIEMNEMPQTAQLDLFQAAISERGAI